MGRDAHGVLLVPLIGSLILGALVAVATAAEPASAAQPHWSAQVTRDIAAGEYHLSQAGDGFTAPNRAHDFRGRWSHDGALTLESRTEPGAWSFSYRLLGVGRSASAVGAVRGERVDAGRIEWERDGTREWYVNDARGIEQGFAIAARPAWTADSNHASALFGTSVAGAGDVNGDGYSDVIVGAPNYGTFGAQEGAAFVYLGSASSLATTATWTAERSQALARFGFSVASAGDVNGDGYSDVIVGARWYDNGETDEGRAYVYYGNNGGGLDRIPRQARSDGSAPIDLLGATTTAAGFRLRASNGR